MFGGKRVCVDTSVIINGVLEELLKTNKLRNATIIIPYAVIAELENMVNKKRKPGFEGLNTLKTLRNLAKKYNIKIEFYGERPNLEKITLAKSGEIDAMIRKVAKETNSILLTSDRKQYEFARIEGIPAKYYKPKKIVDNKRYYKPKREIKSEYRVEDIPEKPEYIILAIRILELLVTICGKENAKEVLDYYHSIKLISEKALLKLYMLLKGIEVTESLNRPKLSVQEHQMFIILLERLAGRKVDEDLIFMLELELKRLKKFAEETNSSVVSDNLLSGLYNKVRLIANNTEDIKDILVNIHSSNNSWGNHEGDI